MGSPQSSYVEARRAFQSLLTEAANDVSSECWTGILQVVVPRHLKDPLLTLRGSDVLRQPSALLCPVIDLHLHQYLFQCLVQLAILRCTRASREEVP